MPMSSPMRCCENGSVAAPAELMPGRREVLCARLLPAALGLAVSVAHALLVVLVPTGRFLKYPLAAQLWLSGDLPVERWVDFSPLLFHLAVFAEQLGDGLGILTWSQIVLVGTAAGLVFLLLEPTVGRGWAVAGALVLALDRHLVIYGRLVEPEIWLLVLVLAALVLVRRHRPLAAGIAFALAITVRPTVLPLALLAPAWWALDDQTPESAGRSSQGRRRSALWALACWGPCVVVLALLGWRAHIAAGSWTTPTMNPGTVFFEGHNPSSRGVSAEYPPVVRAIQDAYSSERIPDLGHEAYRRVARSEEPDLTIAGVNDYWFAKGLAFLKDQPVLALRRAGVKLLYAFHSFAWHDLPAASLYQLRLPWLPALPFGLLSALALVGLAVSIPKWKDALLLLALGGCQLGVMVVFYSSARQRILLLPALIYFAIVGARRLLDRSVWRRRRILLSVLVASLALALTLPTDAMRAQRYEDAAWIRIQAAQAGYARAVAGDDAVAIRGAALHLAATAGRRIEVMRPVGVSSAEAAAFLNRLLDAEPMTDIQASKVGVDAAWLWLEADRPAEALAVIRPPVADDAPIAAWLVARALARSGRRQEALDVLEGALDEFPGRPELLAERVVVSPKDDAEARRLLDRYWSRSDAQWFLGRAYLAHGAESEARTYLDPLMANFPELPLQEMLDD